MSSEIPEKPGILGLLEGMKEDSGILERQGIANHLLNHCGEDLFWEERQMLYDEFPGLEDHRKDHEEIQDACGGLIRDLLEGSNIGGQLDRVRSHLRIHHALDSQFRAWKDSQ